MQSSSHLKTKKKLLPGYWLTNAGGDCEPPRVVPGFSPPRTCALCNELNKPSLTGLFWPLGLARRIKGSLRSTRHTKPQPALVMLQRWVENAGG